MNGWTKCSDEMPFDLQPVLVYIEELDATTIAAYDERSGLFVTDCATAELYVGADGLATLDFQPVEWRYIPER